MSGLDARGVMLLLNSLSLAEMSRVQAELSRASQALGDLGHADLVERLGLAGMSLRGGDVRAFRKAVSHVTARLGHLKNA